MAKEVAEMSFDNMAKLNDSMIDALKKFMNKLMGIIGANDNKDKPAKALAKWITKGNPVAYYPIQGDCVGELKACLRKNHVPFISCDNNGIIVKTSDDVINNDLEYVQELNHDILLAKGNYFQEADIRDFEDAIAHHKDAEHQNVFVVKNLDAYELEVLKNKCNNIAKGFTVAHGKSAMNPELNDVCIMSQRIFTLKKEDKTKYDGSKYKKDFCRAYLQAALSLYGPNEDIKKKQIDDDAAFDKEVAALKNNNNTKYIVGQYDDKRYIALTAEGFTFYDYNNAKNPIMSKFNITDINYKGELQVAMDCIYNKILIDNTDTLNKHLSGDFKELKSERAMRTKEQVAISKAESDISIKIDEMIKDRIAEKHPELSDSQKIEKNADKIFNIYRKEASRILESIKDNKELPEYKVEDIKQIKSCLDKANIDTKAYEKAVEKMRSFETDIYKARPYANKEINELKNVSER